MIRTFLSLAMEMILVAATALVFALPTKDAVSGVVVDAETGRPIAGASVASAYGATRTDAAGRFTVAGRGLDLRLRVSAPGYPAVTKTGPGDGSRDPLRRISLWPALSARASGGSGRNP
jgi:hypothetical protein